MKHITKLQIVTPFLLLISNFSFSMNPIGNEPVNTDECDLDERKKPSDDDRVNYIYRQQSDESPHLSQWETNKDPYIYVSFSTDLLKRLYGNDLIVQALSSEVDYGGGPPVDFSPTMVEKIKSFLKKEWVERAGVPVKFISNNIDIEFARKKNLYFIIGRKQEEMILKSKLFTFACHYPFNEYTYKLMNTPSNFKVTKFPLFKDLYNEAKFLLLHESAHAIIGLGHFREIEKTDLPPFCDGCINCQESVMAYLWDCPPVLGAMNKERLDPRALVTNKEKDLSPDFFDAIRRIRQAHPNKLGPLDLAAAERFNSDWLARNERAASLLVASDASSSRDNWLMKLFAGFSAFYEDPLKAACEFANELTKDCPSSFPRDQNGNFYKYWNSNDMVPLDSKACLPQLDYGLNNASMLPALGNGY